MSTEFQMSGDVLEGQELVQVQSTTELEETFTLLDVEAMTIAQKDLDVDTAFPLSQHTTYFASSPDGVEWTLREEPIARYASVPDVIQVQAPLGPFPAGTLLVYFVDGTQEHGSEDLELGLVYSLDEGSTWSDRLYTSMSDAPPSTIVADPSLVWLEDGRLRMYFYDFPARQPFQPDDDSAHTFHTAVSENGVDFVYEGVIYTDDQTVTDPDVIEFDGAWWMYLMNHEQGNAAVSMSDSPRSFSTKQSISGVSIPGAVVGGNEVWLFSCGQDGITQLISQNGLTFSVVDTSIVSVGPGVHCDPSVTRLEDGRYGTYGMVFKYIETAQRVPIQPTVQNPVNP
jgi:hypothetical protein